MVKLTESIVYIRTKATPENVKKLNLWGCEIDEIELCSRMKCLEVLSLSVNKVSSLAPLQFCLNLSELYLRKNEIASLSELEHLRDLKKLKVLWIDENPCTAVGEYRHKVVKVLPQLAKLDDKPVTLEDQRSPSVSEASETDLMARSFHASTATLVDQNGMMNQSFYGGRTIVDTVMPSQMINYGEYSDDERFGHSRPIHMVHPSMSQSISGSLQSNSRQRQSINPMTSSVHPLMATSGMNQSFSESMNQMSQSIHPMMQSTYGNMMTSSFYESDEKKEEDEWGDFSLDEEQRPLSMDSIAPLMYQSLYDGASAREYRSRPHSAHTVYGRSMSMPRRRQIRTQSKSPARDHRHQKIMSAVSVLLDELDMDGLQQVIAEAQNRIKKQR